MNGKCKAVMVSSYLKRPLRSLKQALGDRARPAGPRAGFDVTGLDPVKLLVSLSTENTNHDGAAEASAIDSGAARRRSPLDRYRAA